MAILKKKNDNNIWENIATTEDFPVSLPTKIMVEESNPTSITITSNGEYYPEAPYNNFNSVITNINSALPQVFVAGDTPILFCNKVAIATGRSLAATDVKLTIPKTGQYRIKWAVGEGDGNGYEVSSRLYVNGTALGSQHSTTEKDVFYEDLDLNINDEVVVWVSGYSASGYYGSVGNLVACIDWNNGFQEE